MGTQLISNPGNAFGQPTPNIQGQSPMQNEDVTVLNLYAGYATPTYGDLVVADATGTIANTTTTAADVNVVGVVSQKPTPPGGFNISTSASGLNVIPVITSGPARIFIGTNTVTLGAFLVADTTAARAASSATPTIGTVIAIAKESSTSKDSASTIRCWIAKM